MEENKSTFKKCSQTHPAISHHLPSLAKADQYQPPQSRVLPLRGTRPQHLHLAPPCSRIVKAAHQHKLTTMAFSYLFKLLEASPLFPLPLTGFRSPVSLVLCGETIGLWTVISQYGIATFAPCCIVLLQYLWYLLPSLSKSNCAYPRSKTRCHHQTVRYLSPFHTLNLLTLAQI